MTKAGIAGATGYTGLELTQLIARHPELEFGWLTSENSAGKNFSDVHFSNLQHPLISIAEAYDRAESDPGEVGVIFLCLPHGESIEAAKRFAATGVRVIDLSADFRLNTSDDYVQWYGKPHVAPEMLDAFVYGLSEVNRAQIVGAQLIANPGCYPTSVNLGLYPLAKAGWLGDRVIIDSKSGVSGAGRTTKLPYQFVEANENLQPYNVGYRHRHIAEMELVLHSTINGSAPHARFTFTPHLLPANRGILSTMYVTVPDGVSEAEIRDLYQETWGDEPFIHLLPAGQLATLRHVTHTNRTAISITPVDPDGAGASSRDYIIVATLDNMVKGASGQAIQNYNIATGLPETTGLL